ncbi:MAG: hypothetical protein AAFX99_19470 [Myxococcota bacterium]
MELISLGLPLRANSATGDLQSAERVVDESKRKTSRVQYNTGSTCSKGVAMKRWMPVLWIFVLCALAACSKPEERSHDTPVASKNQATPEFLELFDSEIQNRAFALRSCQNVVQEEMPQEYKN